MKRRQNNKRTLLTSVISLVLSISMLLGTTFSWFTDTVTNKGNRIVMGEMNVDLLMDKEDGKGYVSIADGEGDIFSEATGNGTRWEPGKTEIVFLQVKNIDELAVNYNILITVENESTNIAKAEEVLTWAVLPGETAEAFRARGIQTWNDLLAVENVQSGPVATGDTIAAPNGALPKENDSDYFALAVHMNEEAGNEYQGQALTIDVKVVAKQMAYENDSFGNQYDADAEFEVGKTYYVSPGGHDGNPGTEAEPIQSFRRAAQLAQPGDTVIFEDGVYNEQGMTVMMNSGTKEKPIVYKARNTHKAIIEYPASLSESSKIQITGKEYITIQGFEIMQEKPASSESNRALQDVMIRCSGSNNISIINNKISGVYEDLIKVAGSNGILIDGNILSDSAHEGLDFVNVSDSIVRNNEVSEVGRMALFAKGGSRSIEFYNNYIHNKNMPLDYALALGGSTDNVSTWDSSGYEAYNLVAWNNVIISETPGIIKTAMTFMGAKDCALYNNIVVGAETGVSFRDIDGKSAGWTWNPSTDNPVVKNNIIMNCTVNAYNVDSADGAVNNIVSDYNLFYGNAGTVPTEVHSVYADPMFVNELLDWHLKDGSPAIDAGTEVSDFIGYSNQKIAVNFDYDYMKREGSWDIGVYQAGAGSQIRPGGIGYQDPNFKYEIDYTITEPVKVTPMPEQGTEMLSKDFTDGSLEDWVVIGGNWTASDGALTEYTEKAGRYMVRYALEESLGWTDYALSADIWSPDATKNSSAGIFFRSDAEMKNMYGFRFLPQDPNYMEFCMWNGNKFASIKKIPYQWESGTKYNLKVIAVGNAIEFYVNDVKLIAVKDGNHALGTIGLYSYSQESKFDNIKVTSMKGYEIAIDTREPFEYGETLLNEKFDDSTAAGNWTQGLGTWAVVDGKYVLSAADENKYSRIWYNAGTNWKNYEFVADILTPSGSGMWAGIIFGVDENASDFYAFRLVNNNIQLLKKDGTVLLGKAFDFPKNEVANMKVSVRDSVIIAYYNGTEIFEYTVDSFAGGSVGVYSYNYLPYFDNVKVTEIKSNVEEPEEPETPVVPAEKVLLEEDFADAVTGWTPQLSSTWEVNGGVYKVAAPGQYGAFAQYDAGAVWTDYEFSTEVITSTGYSWVGIVFRSQDYKNNYHIRFLNGKIYLYKFVDGTRTEPNSAQRGSYTVGNTYNVKVTVKGSNIVVSIDGVEKMNITDTQFSSGTIGFYSASGASFDNVKVIDLSEAAN